MQKFVPIEKMSKKARRELMKSRRGTWGALNPVTRRPDDPKKYNRKKSRCEDDFFDSGVFDLLPPAGAGFLFPSGGGGHASAGVVLFGALACGGIIRICVSSQLTVGLPLRAAGGSF